MEGDIAYAVAKILDRKTREDKEEVVRGGEKSSFNLTCSRPEPGTVS